MRRLFAVLVAAVMTLSGCGFSLQNAARGTGNGTDGYRITAVFADTAGLPIGGVVQIGQAKVGTVANLETHDFTASASLDIDAGVNLPAGTSARLELTSALGEQYVVLEPPTQPIPGPPLREGSTIDLQHTRRGPDTEDTLAAVGTLVSGSGIDQVRTIVSELNTALGGREQKVRDLLTQLHTVLSSLDEHSADITSIIDSMHGVSTQLANNRPVLDVAFTRIRPALDVLLGERDKFTTLLGDVTSLSQSADGLLDATGSALTEQLHELRPVLNNLRGIDKNFGSTLASLQSFAGLLHKAIPSDYLMLDGNLEVPRTVWELLTTDLSRPQAQPGGLDQLLSGGAR